MKKILNVLFILVVSCIMVENVSAISYGITRHGAIPGYTSNPTINRYTSNIPGDPMVYCLSPGRPFGAVGSTKVYTVTSMNPETATVGTNEYKFRLAVMYAYQQMKARGWDTTSNDNIAYGTTIMRLIALQFGRDGGNQGTPELNSAYRAYSNWGAGLGYRSKVEGAIVLAQESVQFANNYGNTNYQDIIAQNLIAGVTWTVVSSTLNQISGTNNYELKVEIQPNSSNIYSIDYSRFQMGFLNTTAVIVSQSTVRGSGNNAITTVTFDGTNWDKQDLAAYIDTYYCDPNSSSSMVYYLEKNASVQRMIAILPSNSGSCAGGGSPYGGGRIPVHTSGKTCTCDTSTGYYKYQEIKDGKVVNEQSWKYGSPAPSGIDTSSCPTTCDKIKSCEKENDKFYCKDGKECQESDYKKQCTHSCQRPEESGDGNYYCKESSPGAGDGKPCDESQYVEDCECPKLEEDCEKDPNSPSCEEYDKKCINCNPAVTIPSDCDDLQDYDEYRELAYESEYLGGISDISKKPNACNKNKANSVKSCVLGKKDAAGEDFEDKTTFSNIKTSGEGGNRYCKVYCDEDYGFNLPTAQRTVSGGYFTLSTSVTGTRTCYVSSARDSEKPIDKELFDSDLEAARRAVIDAYNVYAKWRAAADEPSKSESLSCHYSGEHPDGCPSGDKGPETGWKKTWSWTAYNYDSTPRYESDSYGPGTTSNGVCDCSINPEPNRDSEHASNFANATAVLKEKIQKYNDIIDEYNTCSGNIDGKIGWSNDMKFDPEVTFSYNEGYLDKDDENGKFVKDGPDVESATATYCDGETDRSYNCKSTPTEVKGEDNNIPESMKTTLRKFMCNESTCDFYDYTVSKATWVKKEKSVIQPYKSNASFSTYTQYGTIRKDDNGQYQLYTPLPDGAFPISLIQKTGVFPFTITFNNIGQSNVNGSLGRLIGKSYKTSAGLNLDILTAYNKLAPAEKCDLAGNKSTKATSATTETGYVCHYINNCDTCRFKCENGDCSFDDDCTECQFKCDTCIFDGNTVTYSYRTVSLNNLFPNKDRTLGFNWKNDIKGEVTRHEIEDVESPESVYETPQYSFTLTPASLSKIRKYNDEAGSYTNATIPSNYVSKVGGNDSAVYCEQETYGNGVTYSVRCKSRFLDLIEVSGNDFATNVYRITSTKEQDKNAWELFTEHPSCLSGSCLQKGIGPSWRLRSVD